MSAFGGKADVNHQVAECPLIAKSGHWLPDGCGGKTITTVAQFEYDRHGFEGYLGNVGLNGIGNSSLISILVAYLANSVVVNLREDI